MSEKEASENQSLQNAEEEEEELESQQQAEDDEDTYKNNHDLVGVEGIIRAQKNEIEKKKLELRIENEKYFRAHPELNAMV